jgi:hypothetical protein
MTEKFDFLYILSRAGSLSTMPEAMAGDRVEQFAEASADGPPISSVVRVGDSIMVLFPSAPARAGSA